MWTVRKHISQYNERYIRCAYLKEYIKYLDFSRGGASLLRLLYGCDIPRNAKIADTVQFPHHALGVVIAPEAIIEDNVVIQHHVTLGIKEKGKGPVIHTGAYIGAYAIILGNVDVGRNAIIGAGAIITKSVPAGGKYINKGQIINLNEKELENENSCNT